VLYSDRDHVARRGREKAKGRGGSVPKETTRWQNGVQKRSAVPQGKKTEKDGRERGKFLHSGLPDTSRLIDSPEGSPKKKGDNCKVGTEKP